MNTDLSIVAQAFGVGRLARTHADHGFEMWNKTGTILDARIDIGCVGLEVRQHLEVLNRPAVPSATTAESTRIRQVEQDGRDHKQVNVLIVERRTQSGHRDPAITPVCTRGTKPREHEISRLACEEHDAAIRVLSPGAHRAEVCEPNGKIM